MKTMDSLIIKLFLFAALAASGQVAAAGGV